MMQAVKHLYFEVSRTPEGYYFTLPADVEAQRLPAYFAPGLGFEVFG